jgi:hypothetical protein
MKSVGVPTFSDQVVIAQGSLESRRFVAAYGYRGRVTAAVSVNHAKWLEYYERLIETAAPFPPESATVEQPASRTPIPSDVPDPKVLYHGPTVALTGYSPDARLTLRHRGG